MSHALEIRGLRKSFAAFELGPLDLTVPRGAIYGFVGPNGSGKTTTIDLVFGLGAKQAGSISVLGLDHRRDEVAVKQQTGYVSPDLDYRPWRTVGRAIRFVRGFYPSWDSAFGRPHTGPAATHRSDNDDLVRNFRGFVRW